MRLTKSAVKNYRTFLSYLIDSLFKQMRNQHISRNR